MSNTYLECENEIYFQVTEAVCLCHCRHSEALRMTDAKLFCLWGVVYVCACVCACVCVSVCVAFLCKYQVFEIIFMDNFQ